jgi:hypothetical protein
MKYVSCGRCYSAFRLHRTCCCSLVMSFCRSRCRALERDVLCLAHASRVSPAVLPHAVCVHQPALIVFEQARKSADHMACPLQMTVRHKGFHMNPAVLLYTHQPVCRVTSVSPALCSGLWLPAGSSICKHAVLKHHRVVPKHHRVVPKHGEIALCEK